MMLRDLFYFGVEIFPFASRADATSRVMQVNYTTQEVKASPEKVFLSQAIQLFVLDC